MQKSIKFRVDDATISVPVSEDLWRLFDQQFAKPAERNPGKPSAHRKQTLINLMRSAYIFGKQSKG
ncbi:MAG TPA: hypothetical protein VJP77_04170 [Planctomycetota bacterium]|nr:hypothetical protein [Planctomycetota bacterium]